MLDDLFWVLPGLNFTTVGQMKEEVYCGLRQLGSLKKSKEGKGNFTDSAAGMEKVYSKDES